MVIKKQYVIDDIPNIPKNSGGLYAIMPYEKKDSRGKAVFKVGQAYNFKKRFEQYHTYYPLGFYYKNLLAEPNLEKENFYYKDENKKRKFSEKQYYNEIEKNIQNDIIDNGGERIFSTTRVKNAIQDNKGNIKGETEWFYASPAQINKAFNDNFKIYGGKQYSNSLRGINKEIDENRGGRTYNAEIRYKVYS